MAFTEKEIVSLYRKRAKSYDFTANLYYLIGFREQVYRRKSVKALNLHAGDIVVEIVCGTGLNFPLLQKVTENLRRNN
jgi:demethylmenaquinone methyltransferase/2-methoxy-6-polyprenyl-1,4-benzoquinol methylase